MDFNSDLVFSEQEAGVHARNLIAFLYFLLLLLLLLLCLQKKKKAAHQCHVFIVVPNTVMASDTLPDDR